MLQDAGQIDDKASFEDDQGVIPDDEEVQELEKGEFCKIGTQRIVKRGATAGGGGAKRCGDSTVGSGSGPKKIRV